MWFFLNNHQMTTFVFGILQDRWQITIVIPFLPGEILQPQRFRRVQLLPRGELLVINPKVVVFVSQTGLVKYLQTPVNVSILEKFPLFTPKIHPRLCWVI